MCEAYEGERRAIIAQEDRATIEGFKAAYLGESKDSNPHIHKPDFEKYEREAWDHGWECWHQRILPHVLEKEYYNKGDWLGAGESRELFKKFGRLTPELEIFLWKFRVRKLMAKDLKKGFLETLANLTEVSLTPDEAKLVYSKLDGNAHIFVAEAEDDMIVGTATLFVTQRFIHQGGRVGHLEDVATRKGFERRGIGRALIRAVLIEAKKQGCYKVILDCGEHNVPFYEKSGFRKKELQMRVNLT